MRKRVALCLETTALIVALAIAPIAGYAGILEHVQQVQAQFSSEPPSLTQVARMIDCIQSDILNQGTVVIKQPDIWSQARMTKFRKEFEDTMSPEVNNFSDYLSGQIARSDAAAFGSQTTLAATLLPTGSAPAITSNASQFGALPNTTTNAAATGFSLLNAASANAPGTKAAASSMSVSVEPNIHLDEKQDYITHLHRLRRINLGDDTADSAGYGLYLMRVPVSIQPGDKTVKGYGAVVNISMQHDFNPKFLQDTYRNLVINDVVDLLAPAVHELIRSGQAFKYHKLIFGYLDSIGNKVVASDADKSSGDLLAQSMVLKNTVHTTGRNGPRTFAIAPSDVRRIFVPQNLLNLAFAVQQSLDLGDSDFPLTNRVKLAEVGSYLRQELESAFDLMEGRSHEAPPVLMDVEYIEKLTDQVYSRKFEGPKGALVDSERELNGFYNLYESFIHRLPGNLRFRPIGVLCWGIVLEAGLLNRQLREDMRDTKDLEGNTCPFDLDSLHFYAPYPTPEAVAAFQAYVKARWPMISFALEPVTDQQNIEDAYTRRRDLQLAVAFALSSGQISFNQAMEFTRTLQYEAQTIALNQTVAAFAHGNDTFGWRITPRFQTPPDESNLRAVTNLLLRGGPGPNYGLKNSKIEPGLREMTAVVVMPSFVRGMRLDVANNWFRLNDPDDFKLHTARAVNLGRRINEACLALDTANRSGLYRPQDVERLRARLHQLEAMLPLQTARVKVPYENTLGGFALFTQGATALIPELSGYEGIDYIDPSKYTDLLLYGKHFSIYESAVVVGGITLPRAGLEQVAVSTPTAGKATVLNTTLTPLKDPTTGNSIVIGADGVTEIQVKDLGNYDILSREVLRLHIPPNVQTSTREDGSVVVDVYVSTSTGISNKVQIPVRPGAGPAAAAAIAAGYVFVDDTLTIPVMAQTVATKTTLVLPPTGIAADMVIRLQPINPVPNIPPVIDLTMQFDAPSNNGTVTERISGIPWDGQAYTIDSARLTAFATDIVKLLETNTLIPNPGTAITNPLLTSKMIKIETGPPNAPSTTTNTFKINFQTNLSPPTSSRLSPAGGAFASSTTALAAATLPTQAHGTPRAQLPNPPAASRDPMTWPAAVEAAVPAALDLSQLAPGSISTQALPPQIAALPAQLQTLNESTAAQLKTLNEKANALSTQVTTALKNPPGWPMMPPVINVAVPVTNMPQPARQRRGLFHRQAGTPQNPSTPSMLQRLTNP